MKYTLIALAFVFLFWMVYEWIKEEQQRKQEKHKRNRYLSLLLFLLPFSAIAQDTDFTFSCYLRMEGSDQIQNHPIRVQIDSQYINLNTQDTTIKHRIISEKYNPYMYHTEYTLSCGGKMRIDFFWDTTVKSFFFKCPGTHWYSGRSFEGAVENNEYD